MSEKKKGFWSWLGFGKKEEKEAQVTATEEHVSEEISEEVIAVEESVSAEISEEIIAVEERVSAEISEEMIAVEEKVSAEISEETIAVEERVSAEISEEMIAVEERVSAEISEEVIVVEERVSAEISEEVIAVEERVSTEISEEIFISEEQISTEFAHNEQAVEITEEIAKSDDYQEKPSKGGFFSRLIQGLVKTKQNIGSGFLSLFRGKKIDDDLFEELEEQLLIADLGMPTTTKIINNLTQHASRSELKDAEQLYQKLKAELSAVLTSVSQPLVIDEAKKPYVILMVGVNGVGKTTTIGKLARKFQAEGKSVMLAAGDTFRAAAVEQLQVWGERNHIPVIAQATGADSASVIYDAMQSAAAKGADILIADTAGRLQNKNHLMDELKKIVRVMKKYDESAPHEIMLTLDAGTGQNAISQAKLFHEAVGLTGITLTKLDGTAKGGVIFAIADQFGLPIRYIGVGEKIEDLREFNASEFIEALFSQEEK